MNFFSERLDFFFVIFHEPCEEKDLMVFVSMKFKDFSRIIRIFVVPGGRK